MLSPYKYTIKDGCNAIHGLDESINKKEETSRFALIDLVPTHSLVWSFYGNYMAGNLRSINLLINYGLNKRWQGVALTWTSSMQSGSDRRIGMNR